MIPQDEGTVRLLKNYGGQNYQLIDNYGSHDNTRHPTQEGLDDPSTLTSDSESEGTWRSGSEIIDAGINLDIKLEAERIGTALQGKL
jgi:hypothetical protein